MKTEGLLRPLFRFEEKGHVRNEEARARCRSRVSKRCAGLHGGLDAETFLKRWEEPAETSPEVQQVWYWLGTSATAEDVHCYMGAGGPPRRIARAVELGGLAGPAAEAANQYAKDGYPEGWDAEAPMPERMAYRTVAEWVREQGRRDGENGEGPLQTTARTLELWFPEDGGPQWRPNGGPISENGVKLMSWSPSVLEEEQRSVLETLAWRSRNPWLRSRLYDVLWTKWKHRKYAERAIEAYEKLSWKGSRSNRDVGDSWKRAATIAKRIKAGDTEKALAHAVTMDLARAREEPRDYDAIRMVKVLQTLETDPRWEGAGAEALQALWESEEKVGATLWAEQARKMAEHLTGQNTLKRCKLWLARATKWTEEAQHRNVPKWAVGNMYRTLIAEGKALGGKEIRNESGVSAWLEEAERNLSRMKGDADQGLQVVAKIEGNVAEVGRRSLEQAANLYGQALMEGLMSSVEAPTRTWCEAAGEEWTGGITRRIPTTYVGSRGQSVTDERSVEEGRIDHATAQAWRIAVQVAVQGQLVPWILAIDERGGSEAEAWVETQVERCTQIRPSRKGLAKQALLRGMHRDFMAFLPMAVPVLEDMVREVAQEAGVIGGTVARKENEPGLGWNMKQPVVREALGQELAFTLDCLWTAPHGENYRNEVAHGGLDDREYHGHGVVFAWWTLMKWIYELGKGEVGRRWCEGKAVMQQ